MTTIKSTTTRSSTGALTVAAIARSVWRGFADARTVMQNHRRLKGIAELDDYLLADIGLTRDDIRGAYALPVHRDPTVHLAELATANRTRGLVLPDPGLTAANELRCAATGRPLLRLVAEDARRP